jgi:hypothetical protein
MMGGYTQLRIFAVASGFMKLSRFDSKLSLNLMLLALSLLITII